MIKHLGQITQEVVDNWEKRHKKKNGDFFCKVCGSQIKQTTCYVSIHLKMFEPIHAGPGKVARINYPFCPSCDGDIEHVTACYHVAGIPREEAMKYSKEQRAKITTEAKGKVVESLKYEEAGDYWVMTFTDGSEVSFRFMAELII